MNAFVAGKMGVKLAIAASEVIKNIKTASHLALMIPTVRH